MNEQNPTNNTAKSSPFTSIIMPTEDWHVICGWLESVERDGKPYMPTAAKELAEKLRNGVFPVSQGK